MVLFITGASGYLGSQLVKQLSKEAKCVSLVRRTSSLSRIKGIDTDLVYVDELESLEQSFKDYKPDVVINTAALYGRSNESLSDLIKTNTLFPTDLYSLSSKYACRAFLQCGTSLPSSVSAYATTKNMFVDLIMREKTSGMKFINLELEHFYGEGDDITKFSTYVIDSCMNDKQLKLTTGEQCRDFIFIDDLVNAFRIILKNLDKLDFFETIPVGSGYAPSIKEFVEMVHRICCSKSELKFGALPMREDEVMWSCADITKLKELCWQVQYPLEMGLKSIINKER